MTAARLLAFALLLPVATALWALPTDREQPISVEADNLEIRDSENISIYEGNVSLVQGSLEISSERLVIYFNDDNELTLMEMTGSPARFRQLDNERKEMRGEARKIRYLESESLLELSESARYDHGGDTIESELIRIDIRDNGIQAGSEASDDRVKMLILPRSNAGAAE